MTILEASGRLDALTGSSSVDEPLWRRGERTESLAWLELHGLPTSRDEPWHYFPTARVDEALTDAVRPRRPAFLDPAQVDIMAGDLGGARVVFVNGVHDPGASRTGRPEGCTVTTFASIEDDEPSPPVPRSGPARTDGTVALNNALAVDGAVIDIGPEAEDVLLHVVHVTVPDRDDTHATFPLVRITLAEGSSATVVESFVGFAGSALVDSATEVHLADGAQLAYHRLQSEGRSTIHLGRVTATLQARSALHATSVSLGATLARTAFDVTLAGDDSSVALDGLYLPTGRQHLDHTLTVQHAADRTTSTQRFKGVVDDQARGSFTGHVIVDPDTVGTSAHQTNHNILLSGRAEADTRPWLEILADDVRCTHGATVGRLDDAALFYLRSRGIPERTARQMLIDGFIGEIVDAIGPDEFRVHVEGRIASNRRLSRPAGGEVTA